MKGSRLLLMTEQTENATRLARPLIRLAKLVGVATSYVGMSHDYHEIEDLSLIHISEPTRRS